VTAALARDNGGRRGDADRLRPDTVVSDEVVFMRRLLCALTVLYWASVSCVKLSIHFFFRQLVSRVRGRLLAYWWAVLLFCASLAVYGTVVPLMLCPAFVSERPCKLARPHCAQ
jgi:hypothetical protein